MQTVSDEAKDYIKRIRHAKTFFKAQEIFKSAMHDNAIDGYNFEAIKSATRRHRENLMRKPVLGD